MTSPSPAFDKSVVLELERRVAEKLRLRNQRGFAATCGRWPAPSTMPLAPPALLPIALPVRRAIGSDQRGCDEPVDAKTAEVHEASRLRSACVGLSEEMRYAETESAHYAAAEIEDAQSTNLLLSELTARRGANAAVLASLANEAGTLIKEASVSEETAKLEQFIGRREVSRFNARSSEAIVSAARAAMQDLPFPPGSEVLQPLSTLRSKLEALQVERDSLLTELGTCENVSKTEHAAAAHAEDMLREFRERAIPRQTMTEAEVECPQLRCVLKEKNDLLVSVWSEEETISRCKTECEALRSHLAEASSRLRNADPEVAELFDAWREVRLEAEFLKVEHETVACSVAKSWGRLLSTDWRAPSIAVPPATFDHVQMRA
eukprot:TRINITY_DN43355_c0_g1_i1.p1 TRINITY_DN43355_c0_g1~~TRINITY_DN43355_c0_g1_i1.p1  ORF type:complete len:377 (-),score=72.99 TRINITY_DN43355_c0_g1_i1:100-1230(-)